MLDKTVLLSGGTGVLGRFLAFELLRHNVHLIMLVRGESVEAARARVQDTIDFGGSRVEVFRAELTEEHLGLSEPEYNDIASRTTHILHAAASVRFNLPLKVAQLYNIKTTEQMIGFSEKCSKLVRFGFVSTALVAGNRSGFILEDEFEHTAGFKNTYEQAKYEAEAVVRTSVAQLPVIIFRPPLILPPIAQNAYTPRSYTNALYLGMSLVIDGDLSFLPGTMDSVVDVLDNETVGARIVQLMLKPSLAYMVYHITNGKYAPSVKLILGLIEKKIKRSVPLEFCGSMEAYDKRVRLIPWYKFKIRAVHKRVSSFIPELVYPKTFDNAHTLKELDLAQLGRRPIDIVNSAIENIWRS